MKSLLPLRLERDKPSMVLDTGQHARCIQEKQVQQFKETCLDLNCNGRSGRPVVIIQRSNDRTSMVLDPGKNLTPGVSKFHVEHQGLGREAGHVVRCLRDYMSLVRRFWSEQILDLYRCSITKTVNYSVCVVAVEPQLACLNRFPSCSSAESTSFFIHGSAWRRSVLRRASRARATQWSVTGRCSGRPLYHSVWGRKFSKFFEFSNLHAYTDSKQRSLLEVIVCILQWSTIRLERVLCNISCIVTGMAFDVFCSSRQHPPSVSEFSNLYSYANSKQRSVAGVLVCILQ